MRMGWLMVLMGCAVMDLVRGQEPLRISGKTMGSYYSVVIDSPGVANPKVLQGEMEQVFAELNAQMSTWDDDSEITRFNQSRSTDWIAVSRDFAIVTAEARRLHVLTEGALEMTIAPLIEAWGFGRSKVRRVPAESEIAAAMKSMGSQHVEVRLDPPALRKSLPEIHISLNALAPGYAADRIADLLNKRGLKSWVVDVGGENRAGAPKANGDPWRLGVESPLGGLHKVVPLTGASIATSGDYRNFFVIGGQTYSHVLNPKTGRPVEDPPAAVSVIHESCMTADGLATAMMVLGPEKGLKIAKQAGFDVMFLNVTRDGQLQEQSLGRFTTADE